MIKIGIKIYMSHASKIVLRLVLKYKVGRCSLQPWYFLPLLRSNFRYFFANFCAKKHQIVQFHQHCYLILNFLYVYTPVFIQKGRTICICDEIRPKVFHHFDNLSVISLITKSDKKKLQKKFYS